MFFPMRRTAEGDLRRVAISIAIIHSGRPLGVGCRLVERPYGGPVLDGPGGPAMNPTGTRSHLHRVSCGTMPALRASATVKWPARYAASAISGEIPACQLKNSATNRRAAATHSSPRPARGARSTASTRSCSAWPHGMSRAHVISGSALDCGRWCEASMRAAARH